MFQITRVVGVRGGVMSEEPSGHLRKFSGLAVALLQPFIAEVFEVLGHNVVIPGDFLEAS